MTTKQLIEPTESLMQRLIDARRGHGGFYAPGDPNDWPIVVQRYRDVVGEAVDMIDEFQRYVEMLKIANANLREENTRIQKESVHVYNGFVPGRQRAADVVRRLEASRISPLDFGHLLSDCRDIICELAGLQYKSGDAS